MKPIPFFAGHSVTPDGEVLCAEVLDGVPYQRTLPVVDGFVSLPHRDGRRKPRRVRPETLVQEVYGVAPPPPSPTDLIPQDRLPVPWLPHVTVSADRRVFAEVDGVTYELSSYEKDTVLVPPATGYVRRGWIDWTRSGPYDRSAPRPAKYPVEQLYRAAFGLGRKVYHPPVNPYPKGRLPVPGWDPWYLVDRYGRVYQARLASKKLSDGTTVGLPSGFWPRMTPTPDEFGRPSVALTRMLPDKDYRRYTRTYPVAILVARTFLGEPDVPSDVRYLDGDPENVAATNLAWTPQRALTAARFPQLEMRA